jgi:hypothetical protein
MDLLADVLGDAGGAAAPRERCGQLRTLLAGELQRGAHELTQKRSGYPDAVTVAIAAHDGRLLAAAPVSPSLRADPAAVPDRGWLLVAALVGALVEAGAEPAPLAGSVLGGLLLSLPAPGADHELAALAALAFEEQVASVDRLRARALVVPADALPQDDAPRPPIGATHQLVVAAQVAALGGHPADPAPPRSTRTRSSPSCSAAATRAPCARTRTRCPPAAPPAGSCSAWTAWASGAATTRSSRTWPAASPATTRAWPRTSASASGRRPAHGEAERRPAPRLPQPRAGPRHPRPDRGGAGPRRPRPGLLPVIQACR